MNSESAGDRGGIKKSVSMLENLFSMIDLFKYTPTLRTRRNSLYRPGKHMYYGSIFGALLSTFIMVLLIGYVIDSFVNLFDTKKDRYVSQGSVNLMTNDTS